MKNILKYHCFLRKIFNFRTLHYYLVYLCYYYKDCLKLL